jgi:hypothetical protein
MVGTCSRSSWAALPAGAAATCMPPLLPPAPAKPAPCWARCPSCCCWAACWRLAVLLLLKPGPEAPAVGPPAVFRAAAVALFWACLVVTSWHCVATQTGSRQRKGV